jgi:hypothetical protein
MLKAGRTIGEILTFAREAQTFKLGLCYTDLFDRIEELV